MDWGYPVHAAAEWLVSEPYTFAVVQERFVGQCGFGTGSVKQCVAVMSTHCQIIFQIRCLFKRSRTCSK